MVPAQLRVLWLTENYPPQRGGMAQSCDRIVHTLRAAGVWIDVAHFGARYQTWQVEPKLRGRLFTCPLDDEPAHALNLFWNQLKQTTLLPYTHVVAFGGVVPLLAAPLYAAWLKAPLVTLLRGNDFDTGIFSLRWGGIVREALQRSAYVGAVSKDKLEKVALLYPQLKLLWTPNGIDVANWQFTPEDRDKARQWRAVHVSAQRRVLGVFGHLKRKKGGVFLLDSLLRSGVANTFHVLCVGDMDPEMQEWLTTCGDTLACTVLPFTDRYELLPYYAACDFIAIPSFYDGMPNVLLEALSLAVPVLASSVGGMADILRENENALLFAPGNQEECGQALWRAARLSGADVRQLGENGQRLVLAQFTHQAEAERYLTIFQHVSYEL